MPNTTYRFKLCPVVPSSIRESHKRKKQQSTTSIHSQIIASRTKQKLSNKFTFFANDLYGLEDFLCLLLLQKLKSSIKKSVNIILFYKGMPIYDNSSRSVFLNWITLFVHNTIYKIQIQYQLFIGDSTMFKESLCCHNTLNRFIFSPASFEGKNNRKCSICKSISTESSSLQLDKWTPINRSVSAEYMLTGGVIGTNVDKDIREEESQVLQNIDYIIPPLPNDNSFNHDKFEQVFLNNYKRNRPPVNIIKRGWRRLVSSSGSHGQQHLSVTAELLEDGTGGTYSLCHNNALHPFGIFKPRDEEVFSPFNPKDFSSQHFYCSPIFMKNGFYSSTLYTREIAAFVFDSYFRKLQIPYTIYLSCEKCMYSSTSRLSSSIDTAPSIDPHCLSFEDYSNCSSRTNGNSTASTNGNSTSSKNGHSTTSTNGNSTTSTNGNISSNSSKIDFIQTNHHPLFKIGSVQEYIPFTHNNSFNSISVDSVHFLSIFDMIIVNCDRNEENLISIYNPYNTIIPIDHGLTLPIEKITSNTPLYDSIHSLDDIPDKQPSNNMSISSTWYILCEEMCWMSWHQSKNFFTLNSILYIRHYVEWFDINDVMDLVPISRFCRVWIEVILTMLEVCCDLYDNKYFTSPYQLGLLIYRTDPSVSSFIEKLVSSLYEANKDKYIHNISTRTTKTNIDRQSTLCSISDPNNSLSIRLSRSGRYKRFHYDLLRREILRRYF